MAENVAAWRMRAVAVGGLLWAILLAGPCAANTSAGLPSEPGLAFRHYDVDAEGGDLLWSITRASPIREAGRVFHGYTRWVVEWRFQWHQGIFGECRITAARATVTGTVTLPRLVRGAATERARFERYLASLTRHELEHYRNGVTAAAEVEQRVRALPRMDDCERLARAANETARAVVEKYQEQDREYDRVTEHGRREGVSLDT